MYKCHRTGKYVIKISHTYSKSKIPQNSLKHFIAGDELHSLYRPAKLLLIVGFYLVDIKSQGDKQNNKIRVVISMVCIKENLRNVFIVLTNCQNIWMSTHYWILY